MNQAGSTSRKRRTRARSALGLFAAVWLNLALAPCAMAGKAADEHDCPHCPPAAMQGHHEMHGGATASMPCADDLADCSLDDDFSHDARQGTIKLKDTQHELPVLAVVDGLAQPHEIPHDQRAPRCMTVAHSGAPPALHLLNCVFLD